MGVYFLDGGIGLVNMEALFVWNMGNMGGDKQLPI